MSLLRWCCPLFVALVVVSTPALASGPVLSYLKPVGTKRCAWVRQPLPSGKPTVLPFDAPCILSWVSWSPDRSEGLIFKISVGVKNRSGVYEFNPPRAWRVDFTRNSLEPMDLKALRGVMRELGSVGSGGKVNVYLGGVAFDAGGHLVAIFSRSGEGVKEMQFAYRLERADWKLIESKVNVEVSEVEPGVPVLETARTLPDPSRSLMEFRPGTSASEDTARKLDAALPGLVPAGRWMSWSLPGGTLHYRSLPDEMEDSVPATPVRWEWNGKLVELEGLTAKKSERIAFQLREGLLLIVVIGDSQSAHVFDTGTMKRLVHVEGVSTAVFWPEPVKPDADGP